MQAASRMTLGGRLFAVVGDASARQSQYWSPALLEEAWRADQGQISGRAAVLV
jgi:hypothetical protein